LDSDALVACDEGDENFSGTVGDEREASSVNTAQSVRFPGASRRVDRGDYLCEGGSRCQHHEHGEAHTRKELSNKPTGASRCRFPRAMGHD